MRLQKNDDTNTREILSWIAREICSEGGVSLQYVGRDTTQHRAGDYIYSHHQSEFSTHAARLLPLPYTLPVALRNTVIRRGWEYSNDYLHVVHDPELVTLLTYADIDFSTENGYIFIELAELL